CLLFEAEFYRVKSLHDCCGNRSWDRPGDVQRLRKTYGVGSLRSRCTRRACVVKALLRQGDGEVWAGLKQTSPTSLTVRREPAFRINQCARSNFWLGIRFVWWHGGHTSGSAISADVGRGRLVH
ncbi:unnamed protein product, partial [Hapterophycus canaliculatus]